MSSLITSERLVQKVINNTGVTIPSNTLVGLVGYNSTGIPQVEPITVSADAVPIGYTTEAILNNNYSEVVYKGNFVVSTTPSGTSIATKIYWNSSTQLITANLTNYFVGWISRVVPSTVVYFDILNHPDVYASGQISDSPTWLETDTSPTARATEQRILSKISNAPAWTETSNAPSALSVENRFLKLAGGSLSGSLTQTSGFNTLRDTRIDLGSPVSLQTAGTQSLDCATSSFFRKTGGTATITLANMTEGQTVKLIMESTGSGYTITWAGETFRWTGASVPTPTATASRYDRYIFEKIGGVVYGTYSLDHG